LIDGNKLYLNEDVYFQTVTSFSLRVKTDDGKGGTFERIIVISIEFITGQTQVRSNNIVSPNGDGKFDTWKIYNAGLYYDSEIVIVNSIGEIIFQTIGYETEWDGTYNGIELPIGAYFYIIKTSQNQILRGSITLIK
jgi:gliding motility-associated-like protein